MSAAARLLDQHPAATGRLLKRLEDLLAVAPSSPIDDELRRAVKAHESRAAVLAVANARRKATPPVQAAVQRAADLFLTPAYRSRVPARARWAADLWDWLKRGHVRVGLERQPCMATVESALQSWRERPYSSFKIG